MLVQVTLARVAHILFHPSHEWKDNFGRGCESKLHGWSSRPGSAPGSRAAPKQPGPVCTRPPSSVPGRASPHPLPVSPLRPRENSSSSIAQSQEGKPLASPAPRQLSPTAHPSQGTRGPLPCSCPPGSPKGRSTFTHSTAWSPRAPT